MENIEVKSLNQIDPILLDEHDMIFLRKIVETAEVGLALCTIPKGTSYKEDGKPWLQFFYRLSGRDKLRAAGQTFDVNPGMHILIPEDTPFEFVPTEQPEDIVQIAFYGSEQLAGSFFNTYGRADVNPT